DRWNWSASITEYAKRLDALKGHCAHIGRRYDDIEKSFFARIKIASNREELRSFVERQYSSGSLYFRTPTSLEQWLETLQTKNIVGTPEECVDRIREYTDLGVTYFMLCFLDLPSMNDMRLFAERIRGKI
ncbi:hypothetical protein MUP00_06320, partial [Candidatus Bathyarchaeota archaeon]|nr:hypothetical protein [Candidatus Bathyarchaeota archaeon]